VLYLEGMERVELHFHLLPGVDDGPADLAGSLALAREAVADGTGLITCTPHARDTDVTEVPERTRALQSALTDAGIELEIRAGVELAWDDVARVDDAIVRELSHGPDDRRWLLLEAPLPGAGELDEFEDAARELRDRGFGLLIGHPERSPALTSAPGAIDRLLSAGDLLQLNASSLTGYHGAVPRTFGLDLARSGRASVIASDAHAPVARGPALGAAVDVLRRHGMPPATAERMVAATPRRLVDEGLAPARRLAA
jgi:protein-tyrosine phosphatase